MRVDIVRGNYGLNSVQNNKKRVVKAQTPSNIAFQGGVKHLNQVASLTPEHKGLGLPEAFQGGEAVVGLELPDSLRAHENVDARSFMPIWNYNNQKGGHKFLIHRESEYPAGQPLPDYMPAKNFYSAEYGEDLAAVAKKLKLKESELSYVVESCPQGIGSDAKTRYCIIEPTSVKGEITRLSDEVLGETKKVPYQLFKISSNNPSYNIIKDFPNYFVYTRDLARTAKPYSYDSFGNGSFDSEIVSSDEMRALTNILHKQMNTEEFGFFNPANVLCHDRVSSTYGNHIANMSAAGDTEVNGLKVHIIAHNTGRNYQGVTNDPFKMMTIVDDASVAEELKKNPYFDILQKAKKFGIDNGEALSPREQQIAWSILEPHLRNFRDGSGCYNVLKTGISTARVNPENVSTGTVSLQFDKEMKSLETPEAAKYLTSDYAAIQTKSAVNGVTPQNMRLDDANVQFGRGANGLSEAKGFTPFKYDGTNIKEVVAAKEKNARWLTSLIYEAGEKGEDSLKKLFFNEAQIAQHNTVINYLSPIKDGEILLFGFGRPDEQKGFPISTGGFLDFLKRKDVPQEDKLKVKVLLGAGKWNENDRDYKAIVRDIQEISKLDGGIYKHNIMYIDGFTPNRLVACAHYGLFTSRREMCGITPVESKIAGTPYGITKTGGPVDYTNSSNGFMTKEPVELTPERYGLSWTDSAETIDNARVSRQSKQTSDMIKEMFYEYKDNYDSYVAKCKKNIEEKVDWHNNAEYNNGKSANKVYMETIFESDKPITNRYQGPMRRVMGALGEYRECAEEIIGSTAKTRPMKLIFAIVGGVAVLSGAYMLYRNAHKNSTQKMDKVA